MRRPTLNNLQARTLRDANRDPHDWISGRYISSRPSDVLGRAVREVVQWVVRRVR